MASTVPGRFQDKVVIITGSSNGIGRAAAVLFATEGARISITGRKVKTLRETRRLLLSVGCSDDRIVQVVGDLTEENVQKTIIQRTVEKFGQIDILINNAGASAPDNTTTHGLDQGSDVFDYVMNLNTKAAINLTKASFPYLKQTKGCVIMVSSVCALPTSWSQVSYYAASKAALDQIMRAAAITYIADGVRVNSINPGLVLSAFMEKQGVPHEMVRAVEESIASDPLKVPARRVGLPQDIAEAIAFLADPKTSGFIVGQTLVVDGGSSISNPMSYVAPEKKKS